MRLCSGISRCSWQRVGCGARSTDSRVVHFRCGEFLWNRERIDPLAISSSWGGALGWLELGFAFPLPYLFF